MKPKWVGFYNFTGIVSNPQPMLYNIESEKKMQKEANKTQPE